MPRLIQDFTGSHESKPYLNRGEVAAPVEVIRDETQTERRRYGKCSSVFGRL